MRLDYRRHIDGVDFNNGAGGASPLIAFGPVVVNRSPSWRHGISVKMDLFLPRSDFSRVYNRTFNNTQSPLINKGFEAMRAKMHELWIGFNCYDTKPFSQVIFRILA